MSSSQPAAPSTHDPLPPNSLRVVSLDTTGLNPQDPSPLFPLFCSVVQLNPQSVSLGTNLQSLAFLLYQNSFGLSKLVEGDVCGEGAGVGAEAGAGAAAGAGDGSTGGLRDMGGEADESDEWGDDLNFFGDDSYAQVSTCKEVNTASASPNALPTPRGRKGSSGG